MRSGKVRPTSTPSPLIGKRLCGQEDDLDELFTPLHRLHRLADGGEREGLVDKRRDLAEARELEAGLDLRPCIDEGADDALLAPEERDDVEGDDLAGMRAADDQPPVLRERVETLLEELAADVLVDE